MTGCAFNAPATDFSTPAIENNAINVPLTKVTQQPSPTTSSTQSTLIPSSIDVSFQEGLLQSNGECRLPCWWGIMPGQTEWISAEAFLMPYSLQISPFERDTYTYYTAYIMASEHVSERPVTNDFAVWDDAVQLISAAGQTGADYTPHVILESYGVPDQIWLNTANSPREGVLLFATTLAYLKEGFLVLYSSSGIVEGADITTCIANTEAPLGLLTWDPDLNLSYADAMAMGMSTSPVTYDLPLEEATGKTLEEFYEEYSVEGTEACLRTPRNLWPGP